MSNKKIIENLKYQRDEIQKRIEEIEAAPEAVKIHYSVDRKYFYITDTEQDRPTYWMSVADLNKPDNISDSPFTPSYLRVTRTDTGAEYWKEVLPFNFWKVRSGDIEKIDRGSELYKDYGSLMQWKELAA